MHNRDFFYNNYKNHPEPVLKRIAGDYDKLTPEAQEALRDVLREKKMDELLNTLEKQETVRGSLSHLTADEVRILINKRLAAGESAELIKVDLRDKGVSIYNMSMQESRSEENIDRRFMELQKEGKSKAEIEEKLKEEFNLSENQTAKIPERMKSSGTGFIVGGGVLLMIGIPFFMVTVQTGKSRDSKLPLILVATGLGLLILGIMKRRSAAKFIRDSENK